MKVLLLSDQWTKTVKYFSAIFLVAVIFGSLAVSWAFPIFFRTDDVAWLTWAANHDNPLAAFHPEEGEMFGGWRPVQNLAWWGLYHGFGLHPAPYQFLVLLLYGLSFLLFFLVCREIFTFPVALFSLLAYVISFQYLLHIPFWFSDLTFILELFFIHLALYFLVIGAKTNVRFAAAGIIAYIAALLAKEPASLLVPSVFALFLFVSWKTLDPSRRKIMLYVLIGIGAAGIGYVLFNPFLSERQGLDPAKGLNGIGTFVFARWRFYAKRLFTGPGLLLPFSAFYLSIRHFVLSKKMGDVARVLLPAFIAAGLALIAKPWPSLGLVLTFIAGAILLIRKNEAAVAVAWFALPLLGIMTVHFVVRTYLVEASFGFALLTGLALTDLGRNLNQWRTELTPTLQKVGIAAALCCLCAIVALAFPKVKTKIDILQALSDTRMNFIAGIDYVAKQAEGNEIFLYVVDYEDMSLRYHRDILPLGDLEKARRQKTMASHELERFFRLSGTDNIHVRPMRDFNTDSAGKAVYLFAMNRMEKDFIRNAAGNPTALFHAEGKGGGAWIYRID
jgi:hypothetical protein